MAAVETAAGGASLTVIFVALLGPMAGPYVLIVFAAVAGAMWPLSAARTDTRWQGFWLLLRCAATVGQHVFEHVGQILGEAPALPIDIIEV